MQPANGTLTLLANGDFTYTPNANFNGRDSFVYRVRTPDGLSDTATVELLIGDANDPPEIGDAVRSAPSQNDVAFSLDLTAGATDPDGDPLGVDNVRIVAGDFRGATFNGAMLDIDPAAYRFLAEGETEVLRLRYDVTDGRGGAVSQAAVIRIQGLNDAPDAMDDAVRTPVGSALTGSVFDDNGNGADVDVDGDDFFVRRTSEAPLNGGLSLNAQGAFTYTPDLEFDGVDTFKYIAEDANGAQSEATVSISVEPAAGTVFINTGNDDVFDGGGFGQVRYDGTATTSVLVDFSSGFISGAGNVGQDRVSGMASVRATEFGDQLFGSNDNPSGPSPFTLLGRFESFEGMAGDDLIFGQGGLDRASYSQSPTGVKVDLAAGVATEDGFGGVDTLFGVEGVRGSSFDDMLIGDDNDNFFEPHRGNDMVDGAGGEDLLFFGGLGSGVTVNLLTGVIIHANGDRGTVMNVENLEGGGGFDRLNGDHGDNDIAGGDFNDRLVGRSGADRLFGGEGRDGLFGNSGDDILFGGAGRDGLAGAGGMDVLIGGADRDNLTGGEDSDTFVFAPGSGIDVIRDMEIGVDKIDVSAFGFADFDAVLAATDDVNGRAEIRFSDDGADRVQIDGVVQADLLAGDFIL